MPQYFSSCHRLLIHSCWWFRERIRNLGRPILMLNAVSPEYSLMLENNFLFEENVCQDGCCLFEFA